MPHTKHERWSCDVPECDASTDKSPVGWQPNWFQDDPFWPESLGKKWHCVFGLYICEKHQIGIVVDGRTVQIPEEVRKRWSSGVVDG